MRFTVNIEADEEELPQVVDALSSLEGTVITEEEEEGQPPQEDSVEVDLSERERYVLAAVQESPRSALRVIHRTATQFDGSPFDDYVEDGSGWNDERQEVRDILWSFRGDFVENDGQLWYPLEDMPEIEIP